MVSTETLLYNRSDGQLVVVLLLLANQQWVDWKGGCWDLHYWQAIVLSVCVWLGPRASWHLLSEAVAASTPSTVLDRRLPVHGCLSLSPCTAQSAGALRGRASRGRLGLLAANLGSLYGVALSNPAENGYLQDVEGRYYPRNRLTGKSIGLVATRIAQRVMDGLRGQRRLG